MIDDPPVMRLDAGPGEPVRHIVHPDRPTRRPRPEGWAGSDGPGGVRRRALRGARKLALVAGVGGGLVAAVAAARRLGRDTPPLYRSLRATPRDWSWGGHRLTYYEAAPAVDAGKVGSGAAAREPVVLVHLIHAAASAWEMRELFARFGAERRVLAYDLLGFGASDRPDADYDADLYQELLRGFLREVAGSPADVVASSLSAAHALCAAAAEPGLFRSLTLINPTGLLTQAERSGAAGRALQNLLRTPWLGEALYNLLVSRPSLRCFASRIYRDPELEEETIGQRYAAAHQPGARYAPAAFLGDALARNTYMALRALEVPALAVWSPAESLEEQAFMAVAPGIEQTVIEDCGALPHEERPEKVAGAIRSFWRGLRRS
ncbi:MAG TPA: alpha/beta fold hydrolase [Thermoanaerobaculia bacterium]|nr:alpha/beta fold hydrolase [Thermoanaerobaculia bacterium]